MRYIVEIVVWHDASKGDREAYNTEPMILFTIGAVVEEDKKQVVLLMEGENRVEWKSRDSDYQQIPKRIILRRVVVGEVEIPVVSKSKARRRVKRGTEVKPEGVVGVSTDTPPPSQ